MISGVMSPQPTRADKGPRPYRVPVAVIFQTRLATADRSGSFEILEGWSRSLSGNRMTFVCDRKLTETKLCLYLEHPETPCTFFEVEVLGSRQVGRREWEYRVVFRRLLSDADVDAY